MATMTTEPAWAGDTTALSAIWARINEPAEWIASATDVFIEGLRSLFDIPTWVYIRHPDHAVLPWPGPAAEQRGVVDGSPVIIEGETLPVSEGYALNLSGGDLTGPAFSLDAGSAHPGGRLPMHKASLGFQKRLSPYSPPRAVIDDLVELAIKAWDPAVVNFTSQTAHMEGRRTGWDVPTGYRVWISDETGSFATVPDGLSTRRLANGTLLSTPDDWSPYDMVEAVVEALESNGIEEIPH